MGKVDFESAAVKYHAFEKSLGEIRKPAHQVFSPRRTNLWALGPLGLRSKDGLCPMGPAPLAEARFPIARRGGLSARRKLCATGYLDQSRQRLGTAACGNHRRKTRR